MQVDGGLRPVTEEDVIRVRHEAGKAVQAVFKYLGLTEVTDEQVEAVTYAHGSKDTLKRDVASDLMAADDMMKRGIKMCIRDRMRTDRSYLHRYPSYNGC